MLENHWFNVATPKHVIKRWVAACRETLDSTKDIPVDPLQHIELNLWEGPDLGTVKEDRDAQGLIQPIRCQRVKASKQILSQWNSEQRKNFLLWCIFLRSYGWWRWTQYAGSLQVVLLISFTDLLSPNVPLSSERALSLVLAVSPWQRICPHSVDDTAIYQHR